MKIKIYCTDKNQWVDGDVLNHRQGQYLEVALNTVKLRLTYFKGSYIGSMAGLEFVVKEKDIPEEPKYRGYMR